MPHYIGNSKWKIGRINESIVPQSKLIHPDTPNGCEKVDFIVFCFYCHFHHRRSRKEARLCDRSLAERLPDCQDRWPIRLGWLKRELNLNGSFPLRDETSSMAWPLPGGSLSFSSGHIVISHIAVSLNLKIIRNTLVKAGAWKIQIEIHTVAVAHLIPPCVWCHRRL